MKRSHEEIRAALLRERAARHATYVTALAQRNSIATVANGPDALDYDRRALARADARVEVATQAMRNWKDPLPAAKVAAPVIAQAPTSAPLDRPGAMSPADRLVAQILAAAEGTIMPTVASEGDRLAQEIIASAELAGADDDVEALARKIAAL